MESVTDEIMHESLLTLINLRCVSEMITAGSGVEVG